MSYSTPSKYLDAIIAANFTLPVTYNDIVPYADIPNSFWTGYFTSRANLKKYVRDVSHNLHASNELYAMRVIDQSVSDEEVNEIMNVRHRVMDILGIL